MKVRFALGYRRYNQVQETLKDLCTNFPPSTSQHASTVQEGIKPRNPEEKALILEVDEVTVQGLFRLIGQKDLIPNPEFRNK